ncbi:MAG TPA: hypothetical protein PLY05_06705 [Agitococcus sp.]|nr:hypothetical protein [Agitococcus sp.]HNC03030.1 hypothetical protein [Agitococcus sp.]HNH44578.1 hypothetical protein [Agitococcus sp.]HNN29809.1 hypothetical protein [Agitococcus sp.]
MKARYVVDTNVLIAASAIQNAKLDVTPDDPVLCQQVFEWLSQFEQADSYLVLDGEGKIHEEYEKKLGFNDYGLQVLMLKYSQCQVDMVDVLYDDDGYAFLEEPLASAIYDRSDRKIVAAALEGLKLGECEIANASDADWYDWTEALEQQGLLVHQIIPDWSKQKWQEKKQR